jgi:DNA-binding CsgD family transcriptional regulator
MNPEGLKWVVQRRSTPTFLICDRSGKTLFSTPGLTETEGFAKSKRVLDRYFSKGPAETETFEALDETVILRIMPLAGNIGYYAIFLETIGSRPSLDHVAKLYGLTKREIDVLALVLRGLSGAKIAEQLFISEGTVGDHMKNLFRKTKTNRRSALVASIFYAGDIPGEEPADEAAIA